MNRTCLACNQREADTLPEFPALCTPCLNRAGDGIEPGANVICDIDHGCSGTVERLADEMIVAVRNPDGRETWVPRVELVRVLG